MAKMIVSRRSYLLSGPSARPVVAIMAFEGRAAQRRYAEERSQAAKQHAELLKRTGAKSA